MSFEEKYATSIVPLERPWAGESGNASDWGPLAGLVRFTLEVLKVPGGRGEGGGGGGGGEAGE